MTSQSPSASTDACPVLMGVALTILPLSLNAVGGLAALHAALPERFSFFQGYRGTLWFLAAYCLDEALIRPMLENICY